MWHINKAGDPGKCTAVRGNCPFGTHFENAQTAREAFEHAAGFQPLEFTSDERSVQNFMFDIVVSFNESIKWGGMGLTGEHPYVDVYRDPEISRGNSSVIANDFHEFTEGWSIEEDGLEQFGVIAHKPVGSLVNEHAANVFTANGIDYIVDFGFAEIDPNREWPYVGTVDAWRNEVDKASVLGAPELIPEPIDPRTLSLPTFPPGESNPLLERATTFERRMGPKGDLVVKYLVIDEVKVAAAKYELRDGVPSLHSLETRAEYRNQGYMKKLLSMIASEHGVEKVRSSGSMTHDGMNFTAKYTEPPPDGRRVTFPDFGTTRETFSFVQDWVEGYSY